MNNGLRAAIVAVSVGIPLYALGQDSTSARPDVAASPGSAIRPADPSTGKWMGDWQCSERCRNYGSMEMEVDVVMDQVTGRVRSTNATRFTNDCSLEWEKLSGDRKGEKVFAQYDLGGRCGKVDLIFSIDPDGKIMTGTWSSQWPSNGTFRLQKTATAGFPQ